MKRFFERYPHTLMAALLLVAGLVSILWGERISANGGLGWDGQFYVGLAKNFYESVFVNSMDSYHTQRILPSGIIHYSLRLFGFPLDTPTIITAFQVYNLLLLLLSCRFWKRIGDELNISLRGRWLGFIGLFTSFAVLKMSFYYPNLTDTTAITFGMAMVHFYLRRQTWGLVLTSLLGAFVWPTLVFGGAALIVFPRSMTAVESDTMPAGSTLMERVMAMKLNLPVAAAGALGVLGFIIVFHFIKPREYFGWGTAPIVEQLYYPSILLLVGYVFMLLYILFEGITVGGVGKMVRSFRWQHILAAAVMFVVSKGLLAMITDPAKKSYTLLQVAKGTILIAITRPLLFIVPHIIYFGPIILLAVLLWRPISRLMRSYGFGLVLFFLANLPMALNPESRRSVLLMPLVVILTVVATEELNWKRWHYWALGVIALVFSKIWYPINQGPLEGDMLKFPAQHYFMNAGPWVADGPYLVQAVAALLAGALLYWMIRKGRVAEAAERSRITPALVPEGKVHA